MRRHFPAPVSRGGPDLRRLLSMVMMLAVLALMIYRARDPAMWRWLVPEGKNVAQEVGGPPQPPGHAVQASAAPAGKVAEKAPAKAAEKPAAKPASANAPVSPVSPAPDNAAVPPPPAPNKAAPSKTAPPEAAPPLLESIDDTDLDPEEMEEAQIEFQAVSDNTMAITHADSVPYLRVLKWVDNQSAASMSKRALRGVRFNDLAQSPDKYRGKLVEMELDVRVAVKCDPVHGYDDMYEIWGFNQPLSGFRLYTAIVIGVPEGMPTGPEIKERVRLVGYFFKLQDYEEGGAKPHARPLYAPFFIGRMMWLRKAVAPPMQQSDWYWIAGVAAFFVLLAGGSVGMLLLRRRRGPALAGASGPRRGLPSVDHWLDQVDDNGDEAQF